MIIVVIFILAVIFPAVLKIKELAADTVTVNCAPILMPHMRH